MSSSPVKYESTFKSTDLLERKLEHNGRKAKCISFSGSEGFEALFAVIRHFNTIAKQDLALYILDAQNQPIAALDYKLMFSQFKHVLRDQALAYWEKEVITNTYPDEDQHTLINWNTAIKMMKRSFGGGKKARDYILEYLQTKDCRKTVKVSVQDHVRRIDQLLDYADESEGSEAITTRYKRNRIMLDTFPQSWQHNFATAAKDLSIITSEELVEFFSAQKEHFDIQFNQKKQRINRRNRHNQFSRSFYNSNDTQANKKLKTDNIDPNALCPLHMHLQHNHAWNACHFNPKGNNYKPWTRNRNNNNNTHSNSNRPPFQRHFQQGPYQQRHNMPRRTGGEQHFQDNDNENEDEDTTINSSYDNSNEEMHAYEISQAHKDEKTESKQSAATHTGTNWFFQRRPDQPHNSNNQDGA